VTFEQIAELEHDLGETSVYAEGWQSWSPAGVQRADVPSRPAPDARQQTMGWRPGRPVPAGVIQAEGLLVVAAPDAPALALYAPDSACEVATLRLDTATGTITADGPVEELRAASLEDALVAVAERLRRTTPRPLSPGWCSWSYYFQHVTAADVVENLEAIDQLNLPLEIVQIDDGYEPCVGDWLDRSERFGPLSETARRITAAGKRAGIWTAPFLVGERSRLAREHPDWLLDALDAGWNWNQRLRVLDVAHPAAGEHLQEVFRTLAGWGFDYHKLDFLYAGALRGLEGYRHGLRLVRDAVGPDATLLGCGAPLLPSIGLVDAMRIGPDVLAEEPGAQPDVDELVRRTAARAWMNGRLWVNDPDCLVARPAIAERDAWAGHLFGYGGLSFSSDRLAELDEHGLELTRQLSLGSTVTEPPST
jgi:alpha-galactosidase